MSLDLYDNLIKCYLITWDMFSSIEYIIRASKEARCFLKRYNNFIGLVKSFYVVQVFYNTVFSCLLIEHSFLCINELVVAGQYLGCKSNFRFFSALFLVLERTFGTRHFV